jgi:hypothetical protein
MRFAAIAEGTVNLNDYQRETNLRRLAHINRIQILGRQVKKSNPTGNHVASSANSQHAASIS